MVGRRIYNGYYERSDFMSKFKDAMITGAGLALGLLLGVYIGNTALIIGRDYVLNDKK